MQLEQLDFYSFFTKYSLMEEYGFGSGLISRIFRKILPVVPDEDTLEYVLLDKDDPVTFVLSHLDFDNIADSPISQQLDMSIKALCAKVVAFGLDSNIKAKYDSMEQDSKPFESLFEKLVDLTKSGKEEAMELLASLEAVELLIIDLRKNKNRIGTSFHLTLTTKRILEYTNHAKSLIELKTHISSKKHWEKMLTDYVTYRKKKNSLRRYVRRHSDLVALEIVEHTSNKGEKYIAESRKEYWTFFQRSLLGGGIIAVFAFLKLIIDSYQLTQLSDAFFFSINYALCFIIVKQVGGVIATKQPAMTASTIAKNIDKQDNLTIDSIDSVTVLVRKVFRTQFISIIGNFMMALAFACGIMYCLQLLSPEYLSQVVKPKYLIANVTPSIALVSFAAIAGFFLALSGLISGYVDNKVVASKIAYRIRNSRLFLNSNRLATFSEKKAGAFIGNICLGFLLGSTFLLSNVLPFPVDIRHIAFSSANVGFSIMSYDFNGETILLALLGALLIGLINFIVSFSITLYLALKSRGLSFKLIPKVVFNISKDFLRNPLAYFMITKRN